MCHLSIILALVVQSEVIRLGHDDYLQREHASATLRSLMPIAHEQVVRATRHSDPEVARRAEFILADFRQAHALWYLHRAEQLRCRGYRAAPWIDSLPVDYPNRRYLICDYLSKARRQTQIPIRLDEPFHAYRVATIYFVADRLKQGASEQELIDLYEKMALKEMAWIKKHRPQQAQVLSKAVER